MESPSVTPNIDVQAASISGMSIETSSIDMLPVFLVYGTHFSSYTTAPSPPTDLRAMFTGNSTIAVSWTPPSGGTPPTGYIIYYEATSGGADTGSATVSGANTSEVTITGRTSGAYTVRIVALSTQLPSNITETFTAGGESMSVVFTAYWYAYSLPCFLYIQ